MVAPPSSPGILTGEAVRTYFSKHSLVPLEAKLAVRRDGETRKGEQYLLPASKTHLYP